MKEVVNPKSGEISHYKDVLSKSKQVDQNCGHITDQTCNSPEHDELATGQ